jgi:hypothetical protein
MITPFENDDDAELTAPAEISLSRFAYIYRFLAVAVMNSKASASCASEDTLC